MAILRTTRLILRPLTMDDADDMYEYSCEPNVGPNAGWKAHESIDETREVLQTVFLGQRAVFGLVLADTGKLVGSIGLIDDAKRQNPAVQMLGYAMSETCWGRGLMTEAAREVCRFGLEELELMAISAYTFPLNIRSKRVLEKVGFRYEGCLKYAEQVSANDVRSNECYLLERADWRRE